MNSALRFILIALLLAIAAGAGFLVGRHTAPSGEHEAATSEPADDNSTVATVTATQVRQGDIAETFTAYGSVIADPGEVRVLSVQYESRIARVLATPGQSIDAGAEVISIEPSPDTRVALEDARNAADAAAHDLRRPRRDLTSIWRTTRNWRNRSRRKRPPVSSSRACSIAASTSRSI